MATTVKVKVPATSANLGPGFDCLGTALALYNSIHVEVREKPGVSFEIFGEGADSLPKDETNLIYQTMLTFSREYQIPLPGVQITLHNEIPSTRGLGSSATAIVMGLAAANEILDIRMSKEDLLQLATRVEGHPDNVAPAILGGVVIAGYHPFSEQVEYKRFRFPDHVGAVVAIPSYEVSTDISRAALPAVIPRTDAVYNVAQIGMMMASIAQGDFNLFAKFANDRLHEPYRLPLMPGTKHAIQAARDAGASCVTLSGSGPSLLALYRKEELGARDPADSILRALKESFSQEDSLVSVIPLGMDTKGLVVETDSFLL